MSEGEPPKGPKGGNRRARALASGIVLVVAVAFIVSSTWQITDAVFYARPANERPPTPAEAECVARLRPLESALERAARAATRESWRDTAASGADRGASATRATDAFQVALAPEWNDEASAERACDATPRSREAWAALLRLRRGLEGRARKDASEIGPLRRDFETRLP